MLDFSGVVVTMPDACCKMPDAINNLHHRDEFTIEVMGPSYFILNPAPGILHPESCILYPESLTCIST